MSKTQYNYFSGTLNYFQGNNPDNYGNYSVNLTLDDREAYDKSGIQVSVGENDDVWFRRPHQKIFGSELQTLGPPRVVDKEGNDFTDLVGKGSKVIAKVRSYPTAKGIGHTLDAIQVVELVPVERGDSYHNF